DGRGRLLGDGDRALGILPPGCQAAAVGGGRARFPGRRRHRLGRAAQGGGLAADRDDRPRDRGERWGGGRRVHGARAGAGPRAANTFRAIAATHAAVGAEYMVHLPPLYRDDKTWEFTDDRELTGEAWKLYVNNANRLGKLLKEDYGLTMVLHPHGDSHIETPEEISRI